MGSHGLLRLAFQSADRQGFLAWANDEDRNGRLPWMSGLIAECESDGRGFFEWRIENCE